MLLPTCNAALFQRSPAVCWDVRLPEVCVVRMRFVWGTQVNPWAVLGLVLSSAVKSQQMSSSAGSQKAVLCETVLPDVHWN